MSATDRFLASTRGRILARLLRDPATVSELAADFEISENAVRQHVNGLEREGYAERHRIKHTASKPAALYRATPAGEALFPKGYGPVLNAVTDELLQELPRDLPQFLDNVGLRLADRVPIPPEATREERFDAAIGLLEELGAILDVGRTRDGVVILQGKGCPLSAVVRRHPEYCRMIGALLEDIVILPVDVCCRNDRDNPSCRFVVGRNGGEPPDDA